ncbi:hypothetical protein C8Q75DRAFT_738056 [Abortiporus biennis]|nr:hypothetical protein C8Q75DRAFT_738056 [Abortiporus biennis]
MRKRSPEVGGSNKMAFSIRPSFGLLIFERYYKKPIKDKETVSRGHLCAGQVSIRMYQYRRIVVETVLGYTVTTISLACYSRLLLVDVLRRDTNVTGLWRINSVESGSRKPAVAVHRDYVVQQHLGFGVKEVLAEVQHLVTNIFQVENYCRFRFSHW